MKRAGMREFWEVLVTGADRIVSGHRGESAPTIFPSLMQIPRRDRVLVPYTWAFTSFLARGEQGTLINNQDSSY